jgi:hypothetical protein
MESSLMIILIISAEYILVIHYTRRKPKEVMFLLFSLKLITYNYMGKSFYPHLVGAE